MPYPSDRASHTLPRHTAALNQEPVPSSSPTQADNGWHTLPKYYPNAANFNDEPVPTNQGQSVAKKNRTTRSPPPPAITTTSPTYDYDIESEPHAFTPYLLNKQYPSLLQPYCSTPLGGGGGGGGDSPYDSSASYPISMPRYMDTPPTDLYGRHSPYQRQPSHVSPSIGPPPPPPSRSPIAPIAPAHGHQTHSPENTTSSPSVDGRRRHHRHKPRPHHHGHQHKTAAHPPPVTESAQAAQNLLAYCDELLADLEKVAKS